MEFEKRRVALADIRPSGQNPREDFGDIGALARAIEATGGEPVNPPVVVEDGNVYRIVDGERRYRALKAIWPADREVAVLCAASMDAANELTAMLATDDKRQLTDAERARGVQQMLVLGVDEQRIERASRATAGQVRAARRLAGRVAEGAQVTLEQLEAASAFEDEADVDAVLGAEDWAAKAGQIRRRNEREDALARDYDALGDAGIPALRERPEGSAWVGWARVGEVSGELSDDAELAASVAAVLDGGGWTFYGEGAGEPEKSEEELRAEAEAARRGEALTGLYRRLVAWIAGGDLPATKIAQLALAVASWRAKVSAVRIVDARMAGENWDDRHGEAERLRSALSGGPAGTSVPSAFETACYLLDVAADMVDLDNRWSGDDSGAWLAHYGLMARAGFRPTDEDEWLRDRVAAELKESDGKDGDDE